MGYRVGQLGTEPHSKLFGMDAVFPNGYASTVEADLALHPELLDRAMRQIAWRRRPDLILVGAQSGTIPFDLADHRTLSLPTLAFLMGTKPDACVLVVNAIDGQEYVADTIAALRSVGKARVIALAVSDRTKEVQTHRGRSWTHQRPADGSELAATLGRLEEGFGLPAVQITSDEGLDRLCARVVEFFAAPEEAQEVEPWRQKRA
jgi:uncharacterized NAD-dependent epimerase/dehydratase family protein